MQFYGFIFRGFCRIFKRNIFDKINSTYTRLVCVGYDDLINYYFTKFIINPWGTLFYKHHDFKSFEVDNIFKGKASRRKIKNEYLILEAITEQWHNLSDPEKMSFYNTREHIDESFCKFLTTINFKWKRKKRFAHY